MPARYQIRLKDTSGSVVAITDHFERLAYTKRVNKAGFYTLQVNEGAPFVAAIGLDYQLEVWRRDQAANIDWYLDFEAFHRTPVRQRDKRGKAIFRSYGVGYADLLRRRIVAGFASTAYTEKNGAAETVAKEFVTEQCTVGDRAILGFSVEADGGSGANIQVTRAWRILLEVLQEASLMAQQKGGPGDFAVVGTGPGTFEFRWYDGQLGADRTVGNADGNAPIVFSILLGNMALPIYALARTDEANVIYVAGQGEGDSRALEIRTDPIAMADSPWNRREMFADARHEITAAALQDKGDRTLEEMQAQESFSFDVIQTEQTQYGRDYSLGDLITARYGAIERNKKIVGVGIVVEHNKDTISVELADVP